jgi:hypothetical protein
MFQELHEEFLQTVLPWDIQNVSTLLRDIRPIRSAAHHDTRKEIKHEELCVTKDYFVW